MLNKRFKPNLVELTEKYDDLILKLCYSFDETEVFRLNQHMKKKQNIIYIYI